jgi:hypothetical protein
MEYSYKIIRSSVANNVMEVEFSAANHDTLVIGMPLPVEGQDYLEIIRAYAPVQYWVRSKQVTVDVPVGEIGTLRDVPVVPLTSVPPDLTPEQIAQMLTPPATPAP